MGAAMNLTPAAVLERAAYEDALGNRRTADMLRALVNARNDALEEGAKVADLFAEENFAMATDSILLDPLLSAHRLGRQYMNTPANNALVEQCQDNGTIHSSSAHAAQNVAAAIRALKDKENRHD